MRTPAPITAPSSITAVGWMTAVLSITNITSQECHFRGRAIQIQCRSSELPFISAIDYMGLYWRLPIGHRNALSRRANSNVNDFASVSIHFAGSVFRRPSGPLPYRWLSESSSSVTGRRNRAGDGRRNGASRNGVKRRFERAQECGFLPDLATAFSLLPGIGLGLRKLSPSITTR